MRMVTAPPISTRSVPPETTLIFVERFLKRQTLRQRGRTGHLQRDHDHHNRNFPHVKQCSLEPRQGSGAVY